MSYEYPYQYVWNSTDDVTIWQTTHHPHMRDGKPWGMEIEVAHNKTKNVWVKITPSSGSRHELINEDEAKELMKDGTKLISNGIRSFNFGGPLT